MSEQRHNTVFLYIVVMICLLALGLFMFSKSDFFSVKKVQTVGLTNIAEDEVLRLMGTVTGENIFLTDTASLTQKIKLHPQVQQVTVKKELPDTLVLAVQERVPVALIVNQAGLVEVDSEGIILRYYENWPQKDYPILTGINVAETVGPGQKIDQQLLTKALLLLGQAPEGFAPLLGEVHMEADGQVYLYLNSGTEVRLGHDEEFTARLKLLQELLESSEYKSVEKSIKYIDLTAGKPVLGR